MANKTSVYLITGFLGAGKTTFLNRIINSFPKGKRLSVLMNEFGEVGIDGMLVEGDNIDMLEISRGSIFCVCVKTDFIKGLYELAQKVKPDILLIESTGVANPTDLKRDLKLPIFKDRFELKEQFCVIDAANFLDAFGNYSALDKQIQSSSVFIINKVDLVERNVIEKIKQEVRKLHQNPLFFETIYCDLPLVEFFDLVPETPRQKLPSDELPDLSDEDFDRIVEEALLQNSSELTPPDPLMSYTYSCVSCGKENIIAFIEGLPNGVLRAKGFFEIDETVHLLNFVIGKWEIKPYEAKKREDLHLNTVVIIAKPELSEGIEEAAKTSGFSLLGAVVPYERAKERKGG